MLWRQSGLEFPLVEKQTTNHFKDLISEILFPEKKDMALSGACHAHCL